MCSAVIFKYVYKWKQCGALFSFIEINWIMCHIWVGHLFFFFFIANALAFSKPMAFSYWDSHSTPCLNSETLVHLWWRVYDYLLCQNDFIILHKLGNGLLVYLKPGVTFYNQFPSRGSCPGNTVHLTDLQWNILYMGLFYTKKQTDIEMYNNNNNCEQLTKKLWPHCMNTNAKHFYL